MDEKKNELLFDIGIFKGMMSNVTDEDVKRALDTAVDIFAHLIQGYELVSPATTEAKPPVDDIPVKDELKVTQED